MIKLLISIFSEKFGKTENFFIAGNLFDIYLILFQVRITMPAIK